MIRLKRKEITSIVQDLFESLSTHLDFTITFTDISSIMHSIKWASQSEGREGISNKAEARVVRGSQHIFLIYRENIIDTST